MKQGGKMSILSVVALGIGSMVGAGIFSLMGQAALAAGKELYLSFLLGGVVALLSGLTYSRLGARYPSSGGILDYFNQAFGAGTLSGGLSLIYFATLAVTVAMVSQAFGAYSVAVLAELGLPRLPAGAFSALIIVLLGILNMQGATLVGRAELGLVAIKLSILLLLVVVGIPSVGGGHLLAAHTKEASMPLLGIFGSVGLTFFAYAGYGMMANATPNLTCPQKQLPLAVFLAIGTVATLYVVLSLIVVRQIPPALLQKHADTAVAQAAAPLLGKYGYIAVAIAALVATSSAINATLFSMLRIASGLAQKREIGKLFSQRIWHSGTWGYALILAACLIMALCLNLSQTASVAGATFLISYLAVYAAHWKLRRETGGTALEIIIGFGSMLAVFVGFIISLAQTTPIIVVAVAGVVLLGFVCEWLIRHLGRKRS